MMAYKLWILKCGDLYDNDHTYAEIKCGSLEYDICSRPNGLSGRFTGGIDLLPKTWEVGT